MLPPTFNSSFNGGNSWAKNYWDYYPVFTLDRGKQQPVAMATRFSQVFFS